MIIQAFTNFHPFQVFLFKFFCERAKYRNRRFGS